MLLQGAVYLYALLAAVAVYTRSTCCDTMRRQAFWFAVAFGIRDAYLGTTLVLYPVLRPIPFWGEFLYNPMEGLAFLVYVVLLSYGVLQREGWSLDDEALFEKAAAANLDERDYGTIEVARNRNLLDEAEENGLDRSELGLEAYPEFGTRSLPS